MITDELGLILTTTGSNYSKDGHFNYDGRRHMFTVKSKSTGQRLDIFLAECFDDVSRSMLSQLIRSSMVLVNGTVRKSGYRLKDAESVEVIIPPPEPLDIVPEQVDFKVIYEDDDLLVISKPPGIVVHPACGHQSGTLVHGLLYFCKDLNGINGQQRPGIVHRLDKDTSGLMVVAKNDRSQHALVDMFKAREISKTYHAIIVGRPENREGRISLPIGRHPVNRKKMAVVEKGGREAISNWKVIEELYPPFTFVELKPETGRTHQLRVHMTYKGHPVAGDKIYGKMNSIHESIPIKRQCLHASVLSFQHPVREKIMKFSAPLWPDMQEALDTLRRLKN